MDTSDLDVPLPRSAAPWLRSVIVVDRTLSSWFIGTGFLFAPILLWLSDSRVLTVVATVLISLAGLWLGLLGVAMAAGLARVLRSGDTLPDEYWRSIIDMPDPARAGRGQIGPNSTTDPASESHRRNA